MKKTFRILLTAALTLLLSASLAFADIAPLPDPEPVRRTFNAGLIIGVIILAALLLWAFLKKRKK